MLLPDCGCCGGGQCDCTPETITIDLADGDEWGLMPLTNYGDFIGMRYFPTEDKTTLGESSRNRMVTGLVGTGASYQNVDDRGPHFACQSPENAASKCMKLSPQRLLDFRSAIRGSYVLQRNLNCTSYTYVNTASCTQNLVRQLRLEIALAGQSYPLLNPFQRTGNCTAGYSTYPGRAPSGWIEYRLSAEICIAGDKGSNVAVGCNDDIFASGNPSRCNCYPVGFSSTLNFITGEKASGPCTYSGECFASLTFHSLTSRLDLPGVSLAALRFPYSTFYGEGRAMWGTTSGTVAAIDNRPNNFEIANGQLSCGVASFERLPELSVTGDAAAYASASCLQVSNDVYFVLSTVSPLVNYDDPGYYAFDPPTVYTKSWRDIFGIGAKLRKTVVP